MVRYYMDLGMDVREAIAAAYGVRRPAVLARMLRISENEASGVIDATFRKLDAVESDLGTPKDTTGCLVYPSFGARCPQIHHS